MRRRFRDVITVLNAPVAAGYGGQETRDWEQAVPTDIYADVKPVSTPVEQLDRRDLTIARWWMTCGPDAPIDAHSRVLLDDPAKPLEVSGEPQVFTMRGHAHHIEAFLQRAGESA